MKKLNSIAVVVTAGFLLLGVGLAWSKSFKQDPPYTFHREHILGTSLEIKVQADSEAAAEAAEGAAVSEIDRLSTILSGYDANSEFSRWFRTSHRPVAVSPELLEVLGLFDTWRDRTGGALDASAEAVGRVWKKAASEQRLPTQPELDTAVALVQQKHWALDPEHGTAEHLSATPLMLNSFTKSYIVDRAAAAALKSEGVRGVLVNIGGDLAVRGTMTETVAIADPKSDAENSDPIAKLAIHDRAVATSGDYRRGVEIGGAHYSHIVDPRTGRTAQDVISSTVVAPVAADAGALATAFSVLAPEESAKLAATMPGVDYLIEKKDGTRLMSKNWSRLALPFPLQAAKAAPAKPEVGAWDPTMELTVGFEVARIEDFRSRRPYLAVWIEDKDKFPVKTLALWYQKPRWLPELKLWYKEDKMRSMAEGSDIAGTVSSATRSPGKYTVKWDGKDNAGKLVKAGRYTVVIEAAREHGTYQLMRQEVDFTGAPKQAQLPGNTEIAGATIDYHKLAR
jgi:thiamine biosynthesis lipoprotein ApbE